MTLNERVERLSAFPDRDGRGSEFDYVAKDLKTIRSYLQNNGITKDLINLEMDITL